MISLWVCFLFHSCCFYSTFTGRERRCVGFHYWRNTTNCCSWFCAILLEFSSMFLCKISFSSSSSNVCLPFFQFLKKIGANGTISQSEMFCKKVVLFCHLSMFSTLVDLFCTKRLFSQETAFFPDYFTRDKNRWNSFSKEFSCSCAINKFRTSTICRILNYSQSTSRYRATIGSYLLKVEKKSVIFSGSKQIPQRNTMLSQENM